MHEAGRVKVKNYIFSHTNRYVIIKMRYGLWVIKMDMLLSFKMSSYVTLFLVKPFPHGLWLFALCRNWVNSASKKICNDGFYVWIYTVSVVFFHFAGYFLFQTISCSVCLGLPRPSLIANELSVDDLKKIACFFLFFRKCWMCCTVTLIFWFFHERVSSLLNFCSVYVLQWYSHPGSVICLFWDSSSTENLK